MAEKHPAESSVVNDLALVVGFLLLLLVMLWNAEQAHYMSPRGIARGNPGAFSGDEPHYLVAVTSLLFDGDLALRNNYVRAYHGAPDAGRWWRRRPLSHHTILVDPETREHALWLDVCDWVKLDRCWPKASAAMDPGFADRFPYREGTLERPAHPVLFPVIVAAALAPGRPSIDTIEHRMAVFMVLVGWLGVVLTFVSARAFGLSKPWAIAASALLAFASPWLGYTRSFYPATLTGVVLVLALWSILRQRIVPAALAVSAAAAIKPLFSLIAVAWLFVELARRRWRSAMVFSLLVGACAASLGGFNYWMAGTPLVFGAVTPPSGLNTGKQLLGTLVDPIHGLLTFAPWTLFGFVYLLRSQLSALRSSADPRAWMSVAILPMALFLGLFPFLGQFSYGPRYWVPLLPWLALAAAAAMSGGGRIARAGCLILALVGALIAIPGALFFPSLWGQPPQAAWLYLTR